MTPENLINWGELSRRLSGTRSVIRRNDIPDKHKPIVDKLLKAIERVMKDVPEKN